MTARTHHADADALQSSNPRITISSTTGAAAGNLSKDTRADVAKRPAETQKTLSDINSDKATASFIRRTLCSHDVLLGNGEKGHTTLRPIEDVLPPLTSSNEIDLQLYAIISVIIRDFVQAWYSKITPDQVFVSEVILIIAHCTRALEKRLQKVDMEALLLDEIPELIQTHLSCRWLELYLREWMLSNYIIDSISFSDGTSHTGKLTRFGSSCGIPCPPPTPCTFTCA